MNVFDIQSGIFAVLWFALLGVKAYAFINALTFSGEAYEAAGKLTKVAWLAILGLGVLAHLVLGGVLSLINLAFTIAAFVYLADVRPALAGLTRR